MLNKRFSVLLASLFILAWMLTGCSTASVVQHKTTPTKSKRQVRRETMNEQLEHRVVLIKSIQNSGVAFYRVGDSVKLILPSDQFFEKHSPAFKVYSYHVLDDIVTLLRGMPKIAIKISGYTDDQEGSPLRRQALSKQRAANIEHYLWEHGVDTRLLYAIGFGDCGSVATNATIAGRASNRRIEITFEEI